MGLLLDVSLDEMLLLLIEATSCVLLLAGPEITAARPPAVLAKLLGETKPSAPRVRWVATLASPRRTVEGFMGARAVGRKQHTRGSEQHCCATFLLD